MKVILVNGSPHERGCTDRALREVAAALESEGVQTEMPWIGRQPVSGCTGCGACVSICPKQAITMQPDAEGFLYPKVDGDGVNDFIRKAQSADGFVFGSPVHYASAGGAMTSFLDRAFYSGGAAMKYKPGAAVASCRRAGASATFDMLNKYFTINCMPVVSSNYWNEVHGQTAEDVEKDEEGLQTMRVLGYNLAWLLKCVALGKTQGVTPKGEEKIKTNFIR